MPYIEQENRPALNKLARRLAFQLLEFSAWTEEGEPKPEKERLADAAGMLNYAITKLILHTIGEPSYYKIALVTGVLENVKQEFYRRLAAPYENSKAEENGDVYS